MDTGQSSRRINGLPVLPDELIFEILTRIPAKSLLKFRCVSKSWLSVISSRDFIKTHLKNLENDDELCHHSIIAQYSSPHLHLKQFSIKSLLKEPKTPAVRIDYPGERPPRSASVLGSYNGLVCVIIDDKDLYLWNPCTRKSKKLPETGFMLSSHRFSGNGFGYNESSDDYHVVLISSRLLGNTEFVIYSLKTDSWRRLDDFPTYLPKSGSAVFVNGKLHWAAYSDLLDKGVVSLDLARNEFGELQFPSCLGDASCLILDVLGECLSVNCVYEENMDLWVMKEYGVVESWTKVATVPAYQLPVCISGKGEILLTSSSDFGLYNMGDQSLIYRKIEGIDEIYLEGDVYIESLISPFTNDDDDADRLHGEQRRE